MPGSLWSVVKSREEELEKGSGEGIGYVLGVLTWVLAGGVFVAVKGTTSEMPSWTFTFVRVLIAALFLVPIVWPHRRAMLDFVKEHGPHVFAIGAIGLGLTQGLVFTALHFTSAVNAGIIFTSAPLVTLVLAAFVLREALGPWQVVGSMVAFVGIVVIAVRGSLATLLGLDFNGGDLLLILAAVFFASYTVLLKRAKFDLPRLPLLVVLLFSGATATFPFFLYEVFTGAHDNVSTPGILAIAYAGIVGGSLLYLCYNTSVDKLGAGRAGNLMYLQMVFTAFFAWLILGEALHWYHFLGAGLILLGVFFVEVLKPKPKAQGAK